MKRKYLVLWQKTKIAQKLLAMDEMIYCGKKVTKKRTEKIPKMTLELSKII